MQLNPHHPGFMNVVLAWDSYVQLGRQEAARDHLTKALALLPDFGKRARADLSKEFASEEFITHYLEGLEKAGLEVEG